MTEEHCVICVDNGNTYNLCSLTDLLQRHGIKPVKLIAQNPKIHALRQVTRNYVPISYARITVRGSVELVKRIVSNATEFAGLRYEAVNTKLEEFGGIQ